MEDSLFAAFVRSIEAFIALAGSNPFAAMFYLFINGGWIVFLIVILWGARALYLDYVQTKNYLAKEWIVLRITVPRLSEQTARAAEHIFANLAGAHGTYSFLETWRDGAHQSPLAIEIASLGGKVGYYIFAEKKMRDLIEAAIYAQYPDADIDQVEDYARKVPSHYPDEDWDVWGCEMVPVKSDAYMLKTYPEFEDKISGEFKDPSANLLENMSRITADEQVWFQIVLFPTDQKEARGRAEAEVNKIMGIKKEPKKTALDSVLEAPMVVMNEVASIAGLGGSHAPKKDDKPAQPRIQTMSPGERIVLENIQRKMSKIGFLCKMRIIYVAKKTAMKKPRVVQPFIGAIKQTNTFDQQALKPDGKHTGVNGTLIFMKERRNNARKHHLIEGYRTRNPGMGNNLFFLCSEELATFWHFPILSQVKAPQLTRTEAKKVEAPQNLPYA